MASVAFWGAIVGYIIFGANWAKDRRLYLFLIPVAVSLLLLEAISRWCLQIPYETQGFIFLAYFALEFIFVGVMLYRLRGARWAVAISAFVIIYVFIAYLGAGLCGVDN